jgi:nucleotide-binding universal stress UspA family protein
MAGQRRRTLSRERRAVLVVGHDRFPESDHALATAARLARRLQGVVHVVHAVSLDDYPINPDADDWEQQASAVLDVQGRTVEHLLAGIVPEWSYEVRRGDPVDLLAAAAEADDALMIVVGTRGRGLATALARLVDQSVSHRVMSRQRRPVLVVPHRDTRSSSDARPQLSEELHVCGLRSSVGWE